MADESSLDEGATSGALASPSSASSHSSISQGINGHSSHAAQMSSPVPSPLAGTSSSLPPMAATSSSTSHDERTRELFFLIYRFLETTDLSEVRTAFLATLEANGLLPRRIDALTGRPLHNNTVEQVKAEYGHITPDYLLRLVEQTEEAVSRLAPPPLTGISSLLGSGRFSLLRSITPQDPLKVSTGGSARGGHTAHAKLISFLANHPNHTPVVPSCRYTSGHPANLVSSLISRELSGPKPITHLWPTPCYERYERYKRVLGHLSSVYCVSFDRTGNYIFTGADDRLVKIWSAADGRLLTTLRGHEEEITDMTVDYDNSMVATASCDKNIRVWCLKSTAPLAILKDHTGTITGLKFCPLMKDRTKRYLVSCSNDGTVCFWEYNASTRVFKANPTRFVERKKPGSHVLCLSFSVGGVFLAVGSSDHHLRVYHVAAPVGPTKILEIEEHSDHVDSMQFSNHSTRFLSGSRDGISRIWYFERQSWKNIPLRMSERLPGQVLSNEDVTRKLRVSMVAWNCDDSLVITSVNDNSIKVWDSRLGRLRHVLYGHEQEVFVLEAHPLDPRLLLSGGHDGAIILWDIISGTPIKTFYNGINGQGHGAIFDAKFNSDGSMFVSTDSHGHLSLFGLAHSRAYEGLPEQMFFHTDYRPLSRDARQYVIDEQTQIAPHLMPPAFLVDIDGNPYPPAIQRLVPGRENCTDNQLVPLVSHNPADDNEDGARVPWQPPPLPPPEEEVGEEENVEENGLAAPQVVQVDAQAVDEQVDQGERAPEEQAVHQLLDQRIEAMQRSHDARRQGQQGPEQAPVVAAAGDNLGGARDRRNGDIEGVLQMPAFYGRGGSLRPNWQRKPIVAALSEHAIEAQAARQAMLAAAEEEYFSNEKRKRAEMSDVKLLKEIAERERLTRSKRRVVVQRRGVRVPPPRHGEPEDVHLSDDDEENDRDFSAVSSTDEDESASTESGETDDDWVGGGAPTAASSSSRRDRRRNRNAPGTFFSANGAEGVRPNRNGLFGLRTGTAALERTSGSGMTLHRLRHRPTPQEFARLRRRRVEASTNGRTMRHGPLNHYGEEEEEGEENAGEQHSSRRMSRHATRRRRHRHRLEHESLEGRARRHARRNGDTNAPDTSSRRVRRAGREGGGRRPRDQPSSREQEQQQEELQEEAEEDEERAVEDPEVAARRRAQLAELRSASRQRREAHFASITELPDAFRPPEWLTDVCPRRTPYFPQIGDEVVYFRSGHQQYLNAVKSKGLYKLNSSVVKPFKLKNCDNDEIFARVEDVAFNIKAGCGVRVATVKMVVLDPANEDQPVTGVHFTIKYHDVENVVDFVILKKYYEQSISRDWKPSDEFRAIIDDKWWIGLINSHRRDNNSSLDTWFQCFSVTWANGDQEQLSPWDLEPIPAAFDRSQSEDGTPVTEEERLAIIDNDFEDTDNRIYNGLLRVMEFGQSEDFNVPVDLNAHPIYGMIIAYLMDFSTIKSRLENRFYRRVEAILFDVGAIEANALQYNEEGSEIVKRARIVTTVLRRFISDPDCYDPMPIYTEIVADLEEFMRSYEQQANDRLNGARSGDTSSLFPTRRSTRERRLSRRAAILSEGEEESNEEGRHYGHRNANSSRPSARISEILIRQSANSASSTRRSQRTIRPPAHYQDESSLDGPPNTQETYGHRIRRAMAMSAVAVASSPSTAPRPWQQNCRDLLDYLFDLQDSSPFRSPVDPIQYPTYEQLIDTPMDLTTVKEQLLADIYDSPTDFCKDMRLIFSNSKQFNTNKKSRIYSMTIRLGSLFEEKMRKIMADHKSASARTKRKPLRTFTLDEEDDLLPSFYLQTSRRTNGYYTTPGTSGTSSRSRDEQTSSQQSSLRLRSKPKGNSFNTSSVSSVSSLSSLASSSSLPPSSRLKRQLFLDSDSHWYALRRKKKAKYEEGDEEEEEEEEVDDEEDEEGKSFSSQNNKRFAKRNVAKRKRKNDSDEEEGETDNEEKHSETLKQLPKLQMTSSGRIVRRPAILESDRDYESSDENEDDTTNNLHKKETKIANAQQSAKRNTQKWRRKEDSSNEDDETDAEEDEDEENEKSFEQIPKLQMTSSGRIVRRPAMLESDDENECKKKKIDENSEEGEDESEDEQEDKDGGEDEEEEEEEEVEDEETPEREDGDSDATQIEEDGGTDKENEGRRRSRRDHRQVSRYESDPGPHPSSNGPGNSGGGTRSRATSTSNSSTSGHSSETRPSRAAKKNVNYDENDEEEEEEGGGLLSGASTNADAQRRIREKNGNRALIL